MLRAGLKIKNMARLKNAFRLAPVILNRDLETAIKKAVLMIERESRKEAPVDTGRLRASHGHIFKKGFLGIGFSGEVYTRTEYDVFVHEGTRFMRGRPYMRNAIEKVQPDLDALFGDSVKVSFDKIGRMT